MAFEFYDLSDVTRDGDVYALFSRTLTATSSTSRAARTRRKSDKFFETVKSQCGLTRDEIEVEISQD